MRWRFLDGFVPNPADLAGRPQDPKPLAAALVASVLGGVTAAIVGASVAGLMDATAYTLAIPLVFLAGGLLLAPIMLVSAERMLGLRGPVVTRLALIPGLAVAAGFGAMYMDSQWLTVAPGDAPDMGWFVGGIGAAFLGGGVVFVGMLLAWWIARRERPGFERVLAKSVPVASALVLVLVTVGIVRMVRHPGVSASFMDLPAVTVIDPMADGLADPSRRVWQPVAMHQSEPGVRWYVTRAAGLRLRARCTTTCDVWLDPPSGTARMSEPFPLSNLRDNDTIIVRRDDPHDLVWLQDGSPRAIPYRLSDGSGLAFDASSLAGELAPPWSWLLVAFMGIGVAALAIAARERQTALWSTPATWRAARIGDNRWIHFADGVAQRQASPVFGTWQGEVVVVPSAAGDGGPFRGDGAPADGWVIPGTLATLTASVRASRTAAHALALAALAAGAAPLVAAAIDGLLRPW